jgi:hypothetical protein
MINSELHLHKQNSFMENLEDDKESQFEESKELQKAT